MLPNTVHKYLLDIEVIISELESILALHGMDYSKFSESFISVRAVERDLMIIGEAINKIIKLEPKIKISGTKHIVGLRNMIVHAYDSVDATVLWKILLKDVPLLKSEIRELKN